MSLLFPTAYFYPEQYSSRQMNLELLSAIAGAGIGVTVLTPSPARGVSPETIRQYSDRRRELMYGGLCELIRFPMLREGKGVLSRALRYFLCQLAQYRLAARRRDAELLFAVSTPPTQGLLAAILKKRLGIPFVYNLQDIFPDSMVSAGLTRPGSLAWRFGRRLEDAVYRSADKIIVISEDFKANLMAKGVPEHKLVVIENWVDLKLVRPVPRESNRLFDALDIPRGGFTVTYAGSLGAAQGLETLLRAAALLKNDARITFLIFGGGAELPDLKKLAGTLSLGNVRFFPLQPPDRVPEVYSLGDVSVVLCRRGAGNSALPSKTWSILAAGRPVLASFDEDSALCRMITEKACGVCVPPEDPEALASAVMRLFEDAEKREAMGENGRSAALLRPDRVAAVRRYLEVFESVVPGGFRRRPAQEGALK